MQAVNEKHTLAICNFPSFFMGLSHRMCAQAVSHERRRSMTRLTTGTTGTADIDHTAASSMHDVYEIWGEKNACV